MFTETNTYTLYDDLLNSDFSLYLKINRNYDFLVYCNYR